MFKEDKTPLVVALVLAGGLGRRMESATPKQFIEINGECILHRTLAAFEGVVDKILVVCPAKWAYLVNSNFMTCEAGATGYESLCKGIAALSEFPDETYVMIHDAVRPLVTMEVISKNLEVARSFGNAIAAVETYEALLSAPNDDGVVHSLVRREGMFRAQTPQTFTIGVLRAMIEETQRRGITDAQSACVLAHQLGYQLHTSPGDFRNFKITTSSDLELYEALTTLNSHTK